MSGARGALAAAVLAVAVSAGTATGQVDIQWFPAHHRVVLMGPMEAHLRITNLTGGELALGPGGNAGLSFILDDTHGGAVRGNGRELVRRPVRIPNGGTSEVTVDISDAYPIEHAQTYMAAPVLDIEGERFAGGRQALEVQPGLEIARRTTGLAARGNDREATLRLIHRDRNDYVFFRLDAPSAGQCLGVYELGSVIRFVPPAIETDAEGDFHVLHQSAPDRFVHSVFTAEGTPLFRDLYSAQAGAIRLERGDDGTVDVTGGSKFEADPADPGKLTAPALPPSVPYRSLGDARGSGR